MRERNIDWSYWLAMPEVRVWEAILLSLSIEPDSVRNVLNDDILDPLRLVLSHSGLASEYKKRLRLLCANRHEPALFTPGTIRMDKPEECGVRLVEVGAWLVKLNRTPAIPEELAAAVASAGGRSKDTEEEGPLERESVASIVYNRGEPPEWDQWSEYETLTARQAVLLMHGLNPKCQNETGPLILTPRARSLTGTDGLAREIEHRLAVAESTSEKARSAAAWLEWSKNKPREWEVNAAFRLMAERSADITVLLPSKKRRRSNLQEDEQDILRTLRELGYDPMAYPKRPSGRPGVRNEVWKRLEPKAKAIPKRLKNAWESLAKEPKPRIKPAD